VNLIDAEAFFTARCNPDDDPVLTDAQVAQCIALAAVPDADGHAPEHEEWTPTYSRKLIYLSLKEGWEMKAGAAASRFDFTTDGQNFQRAKVLDHCEAMANRYRARLARVVGL